MSAWLVPLLLLSQPEAQPASQPAVRATGARSSLTADVTIIHELGNRELKTQESWAIENSGAAVAPDGITIEYPTIRLMRLDEDVDGFEASANFQSISAKKPVPAGKTAFGLAYIVDTGGSSMEYERTFPIALSSFRLILENVPGLKLISNIEAERRDRDLNGIKFAIWDFPAIPAGKTVSIEVKGLPYKPLWPARTAMGAALLALLWMAFAVRTGQAPGRSEQKMLGPLTARARRERILRAIELLDEEFTKEELSEGRYRRRHKALTEELAVVLRELDLEEQAEHGQAS